LAPWGWRWKTNGVDFSSLVAPRHCLVIGVHRNLTLPLLPLSEDAGGHALHERVAEEGQASSEEDVLRQPQKKADRPLQLLLCARELMSRLVLLPRGH